jgi:hypothetical protein
MKSHAKHQACSLEENYFNGPTEAIGFEKVFKSYVSNVQSLFAT